MLSQWVKWQFTLFHFLIYIDIKTVDVEQISKANVNSQKKSMVLFGFDVREEDIYSLKPGELITDTSLSVMIRYI